MWGELQRALARYAGQGDGVRAASNLYWGAWIFVMFLVPELLAWAGAIPLHTLSETAWLDETTWPLLRVAIAGFLVGLGVHICSEIPLGKAVLGGELIALTVLACFRP